MKKFIFSELLLAILLLFTTTFTVAQETSYDEGKKYILGGLEVSGLQSYNEQTVKTYTGLRVGQPITVPGEQISAILNKLWGLELFSNLEFYITNIEGESIFLELAITERPTLSNVTVNGVKSRKVDEILEDTDLKKGKKITENTSETNAQSMVINVRKGDKVKINNIIFEGREQLSEKKLRRALKKTKKKVFGRFWKKSKYIKDEYENDLNLLIDKYAENGFRDARVLSDSIIKVDENNIDLKIKVEEERIADDSKPDAIDVTSLYQNNGYLFSSINPVEVSAENDTINFEIRIIEGKETFLDHITVNGNEKTNDHVIYRELRTRPGQKYNKSDIIRSIRELGQLGFFDAEQITPDIQNPNPNEGTVDIAYSLVESGSSQIELQGGYGGGGFIGTLGLSFSNFSIGNILKGEAYKPVPMGDGQTFALRLQASRTFRVYSLNFSEPWLGGKKPVRFNLSLSRTQQFAASYSNSGRVEVNKDQQFSITGVTAGLAKRVQWPDDFFTISHSLSYQLYDFRNYNIGLFNFPNGKANSIAYTLGISRNATSGGRIFPRGGSNFEITAKLTPPLSLINGKDYDALLTADQVRDPSSDGGVEYTADEQAQLESDDEERFKWLEYYKLKFKGDWYTTLIDKSLVLRTNAEFGFLGNYNSKVGNVPFERFYVGGDGLGNFTLDGRDVVQLRGYENQSLAPYSVNALTGRTEQDGAIVYNKFSMELRYPLTLKPSASIYGLAFLEAGNAFNNFQDYNPFQLKRSAGVGLRIFMPAFGLLGIDFGYGFDQDANPNSTGISGWQTHFIIGQQF
ncbi:Outer membrane protein assembly factor BamA [Nymphon striatum]|nr:Outer membrane protein assembly factor BamA [Nymphon striatum]